MVIKILWKRIATLLNVSRSTLICRIEEEGAISDRYSATSDDRLDHLISQIKLEHHHDGERFIISHLTRSGINI